MTFYEEELQLAENENIKVIEIYFKSGINGLYSDNTIGINKNLPTTIHKKCVLSEELGHYYTAVGNILDQTNIVNRKIELKGRQWGYEKLVPLKSIIKASFSGCTNKYELADYLEITEQYLTEVLKYYENKFGLYVEIENYCIYFNPLIVTKFNYK